MKGSNVRDRIDSDEKGAVRIVNRLWRRFSLAAIVIMLVIIVVLSSLWRASSSRQDEMSQQLAQQAQQLERQSELIDALNAKEPEPESHETIPVITSDTIKQQLNSIRDLVVQQYIYTNADKKESSQTWLWGLERPFSGKSILVTYDGVIKAGMDLNQVTVTVDENSRTITVTLPPCQITDNVIPQESINVVEVKNGLFNDVTFDNYNDFISEQKLVMEQKAIDQGLLTNADVEAKAAVEAFLSTIPGIGTGENDYKLIVN